MIFEEERDYATVAASSTKAKLGPVGNKGDVLVSLTIIPGTTSPGQVTLYDSSGGTGIIVFTGGATSAADLKPINLRLRMRSTAGGWLVTTGANVTVLATGRFT